MAQDKFLIAPINNGLQKDARPWLIMDDAFAQLKNAYSFRGRLRKRFGEDYFGVTIHSSRLRITIGVLNGAHSLTTTVPGTSFGRGQMFSIGNELLTVTNNVPAIATLANGGIIDTGIPQCTSVSYNTTTGLITITGSAEAVGTSVYFYPANPVMGFGTYETGAVINSEPVYAFDYEFIYEWTFPFGWDRSGAALFHGDDTNHFWTTSWKGVTQDLTAFFVSNFHVVNKNGAGTANDDPLWYTQNGTVWATFKPYFRPHGLAPATGPYVQSARAMLPFKNRLLLFNVVENDNANVDPTLTTNTWYPQRCRYSAIASPFSVNAWYNWNVVDTANNKSVGGGFVDCPTDEAIVSVEYLKDHLIVYFENSTWELVYTQQEIQPFVWQKINTELGAVSTFSIVPFDKVVLGVDNVGVHACNGTNVERTDTKIPDQVFEFNNTPNAFTKVVGVRDYLTELVYWSYVSKDSVSIWPDQILVYNYRNGSWAIFDDCITAFANISPQTGMTSLTRVLAGNQQGFTFTVDADTYRNAPAMQISKMTDVVGGINLVIVDHSLVVGNYIAIENAQGIVAGLNNAIFVVANVVNAYTVTITTDLSGAGYTGGGNATRVSKIDILSKQYNPYIDKASNVSLNKIDFAVEKTTAGKLMMDYYTSSSAYSTVNNSATIAGTNVLDTFPYPAIPFETQQTRLWHTIYFNTEGDCIQLHMYLSPDLMTNPAVAWSNFDLDGMLLYTQPTGRVS